MDLGSASAPRGGEPEHAPGGELDRADPRQRARRGLRSGRDGGRARDGAARLHRRAPASAAAPALRADPLRGPALAGERGGRAARDQRRVDQQRPAARAGDARRARRERDRGTGERGDAAQRELLARYVEAFEAYDLDAPHRGHPRGRAPVDAALRPVARRARRHPRVVVRAGHRLSRLAARARRVGQRRRSPSGSTSRARPAAATSRGRCTSSSSATAGSTQLTFFLDTQRLFPLFGLPPRMD